MKNTSDDLNECAQPLAEEPNEQVHTAGLDLPKLPVSPANGGGGPAHNYLILLLCAHVLAVAFDLHAPPLEGLLIATAYALSWVAVEIPLVDWPNHPILGRLFRTRGRRSVTPQPPDVRDDDGAGAQGSKEESGAPAEQKSRPEQDAAD